MWSREDMQNFIDMFERDYGEHLEKLLEAVINPDNSPEDLLIYNQTIGSFALQYKIYEEVKEYLLVHERENVSRCAT